MQQDPAFPKRFSSMLLQWHRIDNNREMPWKGIRDPYRIWLSEIILQQTRVEQGLNYYTRFISTFPDVQALAAAPDEQVFKLWEGLGYYSRCRNLIRTAKIISEEFQGKFPGDYESILSLPGIGPYTASAISSFAFGLPHAVVDGNVYRVLARIFGISTATDSTEGKKIFSDLANNLLAREHAGSYNQAIMDFGAMICKPVNPLCTQCVFNSDCIAYNTGMVRELPVKNKKNQVRKRWFNYLIIQHEGSIAIRQRTGRDIWQDLWEFPLIESNGDAELNSLAEEAESLYGIKSGFDPLSSEASKSRQQLSHQLIMGSFIHIKLDQLPEGNNNWKWVRIDELKNQTFPVLISKYLQTFPSGI